MGEYTLITGASSGVGRETAIRLSATRNLIINGRNEERLSETKEMCSGKNDIIMWPFDLSHSDILEEKFTAFLKEKQVSVDALIYCAGAISMLPIRSLSYDIFLDVYKVNVFSPALLSKILFSKRYNKLALKSIVFISSNISNRGAAAFSVYGSSKSALDGLMRNLAIEFAPRVRVNSILPGGMVTRMTSAMYNAESANNDAKSKVPLGQGEPKDIASVAEFLISSDSAWITGQQLTVDGGRTIDITDGRSL